MEPAPILVATDFTQAASHALHHAGIVARPGGNPLVLMHVKNEDTRRLLGRDPEELETVLRQMGDELHHSHGVECRPLIREGKVLDQIIRTAIPPFQFLVIGTHGTRGLRQSLLGPDMLHIARKAAVPVLAVPENNSLTQEYRRIVFPFGGHERFVNKIEATVWLAKAFDAEVHLYAVERPGEQISARCLDNVAQARRAFEQHGVRYREVREEPDGYSPGFARQTIRYAQKVDADLIAVMAVPSAEYSYISKADKERLINNEPGLAILMTGDYPG